MPKFIGHGTMMLMRESSPNTVGISQKGNAAVLIQGPRKYGYLRTPQGWERHDRYKPRKVSASVLMALPARVFGA